MKILITGSNSYIGTNFEHYIKSKIQDVEVYTLDMFGENWRNHDFKQYDTIFHVAGIAHADVSKSTKEIQDKYYAVNTNLAIDVARKAKLEGVKQFIFMSSMIIYSGCKEKIITSDTKPYPLNFYGDSKLKADIALQGLSSESFKVVILRPPMIYGKNSKGNYPQLSKIADKLSFFPKVKNKRSMLYIENLCEFIYLLIKNKERGIFFPQNKEYSNTSELVKIIGATKGKNIHLLPGLGWIIKLIGKIPCKVGRLINKAFGDSCYDLHMSAYKECYQIFSLNESIKKTEK